MRTLVLNLSPVTSPQSPLQRIPEIASQATDSVVDSIFSAIDKWMHAKWLAFLTSLSVGIDQLVIIVVMACVILIPFVNNDVPKKWAWWATGIWFVLKIILKGAGI